MVCTIPAVESFIAAYFSSGSGESALTCAHLYAMQLLHLGHVDVHRCISLVCCPDMFVRALHKKLVGKGLDQGIAITANSAFARNRSGEQVTRKLLWL